MKKILAYKQVIKAISLSFFLSILFACGGGSSDSSTQLASTTEYSGVAQKGPFDIGSLVSVSLLDSFGIPTGNTFETTIQDSKGSFMVNVPVDLAQTSSAIQINVEGFFLNEFDGTKSTDKTKLTSITDQPNSNSVNLLTNWAATRTKVLLQTGQTLKQALQQSEKEIVDIFGIENVHQLDISQNESLPSDNAQLLLLSGALMDVVQQTVINPQVIIDELSSDFADDGKLTEFGDDWFILMQAKIRDNPQLHTKQYAKVLKEKHGLNTPAGKSLPNIVPLASRPVAIVPPEIFAEPGETITLDGSASHDTGAIINFTWFRVDQQTQFVVPLSDRFADSPSITVPNQESELLFALVVTDANKLTDTTVVKVIVRLPPPENDPPIADSQINTNQVVTNEDTSVNILLTGSDPNNDPISFVINTPLLLPHGLLQGTAPNLTYTPTQNYSGPDSFTFLVNDGFEDSNVATVDIVVNPVNDPPVADAGPDQSVQSAATVNLNGSGTDVDGVITAYLWSQTGGSSVALSDNTIANPIFTAPIVSSVPETLTFDLIVTDDDGVQSVIDSVGIEVNPPLNNIPIADAGIDQTFLSFRQTVGSLFVETTLPVTLDGSASFDIEDAPNVLTYSWLQLSGPVTIDPTDIDNVVQPTFTIVSTVPSEAIGGDYIFQLIVTDTNGADSVADEVMITVTNTPPTNNEIPIANAGPDQSVDAAVLITLDGSGSSDADGTVVGYAWTQISGITTPVSDDSIVNPSFTTPNVTSTETLIYQLIVFDNFGAFSLANTVEITVNPVTPNVAPTADAGPDQFVMPSTLITLDGSGSSDTDGTIDTYEWTQTSGVTTPLSDPSIVNPTFTSPTTTSTETLIYQLIVTDNDGAFSVADTVTITVQECLPPIALAGVDRTVITDTEVTLYGSGQTRTNCQGENGINDYQWEQVDSMMGVPITVNPVTLNFSGQSSRPTFTAPAIPVGAGSLVLYFSLVVGDFDTNIDSEPDIVRIEVVPVGTIIPNDPPVADVKNFTIDANGVSQFIVLTGSDPDGDDIALTYAIVDQSNLNGGSLGTLSNGSGVGFVSYRPALPVVEATFTYVAIDQNGLQSSPVLVTITPIVTPPGNNAPIATSPNPITVGPPLNNGNRIYDVLLEMDGFIFDQDVVDGNFGDYYLIEEESRLENGLQFTVRFNTTNGLYLEVRNIDRFTAANGEYRFHLIDRFGKTSASATVTINFIEQ